MELVGARVMILDATVKGFIGNCGIITACSLNCYYVALDLDGVSQDDREVDAVDALKHRWKGGKRGASSDIKATDTTIPSSIAGMNNQSNSIANILSDTECLDKGSKKGSSVGVRLPDKATTQLVRAHVVIGVMLPVLDRGKMQSTTSQEVSSNAGDSGQDESPLTEDVQVAVLYGKRFMPHAL